MTHLRSRGPVLLSTLALGVAIVGIARADLPKRPELPPGGTNVPAKAAPQAAAGLATTNICGGLTGMDLAEALLGSGPTAPMISNVTYTGACVAAGLFSGGTGIIGFESGVVLSSGNVATIVGPNTIDNATTANGFGGDPDLNGLIPGYSTFDAAVLQFDFQCGAQEEDQPISFQFVFASEEYNEFVNSQYNDVFGFFLNGTNIALLPDMVTPVAINNVNCGNPYSPPGGSNCPDYRNNDLSDGGGTINSEMDGFTIVLTAQGVAHPGVNHIKLAIADAGDNVLDSNIFIKGGSFFCSCPDDVPPEGTNLASSGCYYNGSQLCADLTWLAPQDQTAELQNGVCVPVPGGSVVEYDVRYSMSPIVDDATFAAATQVDGEPVPSAPGTPESFTICGLPEGTVYIALRSYDGVALASPIATLETALTCIPNNPPDCEFAAPTTPTLWPPDHRMVQVGIMGVTDPDGDPLTFTYSVTQDEPVDALGDGTTCPDAQVIDGALYLRAERTGTKKQGNLNGRVYTIHYTASDGNGGECSGTVTVCCPHDVHDACVDDGGAYDSMADCQGGGTPVLVVPPGEVRVEVEPQPAPGSQMISYSIPRSGNVRVEIYDVSGRRIDSLVNSDQAAGSHTVVWNAGTVSNGIYFVRVSVAGTGSAVGRFAVVR